MATKSSPVEISKGESGLEKYILRHPGGAVAEVYQLGAHITNFKNALGEDLIFMSSKAIFKEGKAIRGGVPVIFPQFGPGKLPQHGFARNNLWKKTNSSENASSVSLTLTLHSSDSPEYKKQFDHDFQVDLIVSIKSGEAVGQEKLHIEMKVSNLNKEHPFEFTAALHTYFSIQNIEKISLQGLQGLKYIDKVKGGSLEDEKAEQLVLTGETDRVYLEAPSQIKIIDQKRTILVQKDAFPDCVVWNPWQAKCKDMADMGADDWKTMVCAEAGAIGKPVVVKAGTQWVGYQQISKS